MKVDWEATKDDAAKTASGDVVWSTTAQRGYMRFKGLEPNDPQKAQYQLWIFDETSGIPTWPGASTTWSG